MVGRVYVGEHFTLLHIKYISCVPHVLEYFFPNCKSKKDSKDQELIQSSTRDTKWKSNKIIINITNKSQEVSPFPSGDHKAAMNRSESMTNTRHK